MIIKHEKQSIFDTNVRLIIYDTITGITETVDCGSNLIVNNGKQSILDRIINVGNTNEGVITYGAVGTGTTVAAVTQTDLVTETARAAVVTSSSRRSAQTITLRVFFALTVATGSLKEFAWFGGGVDGNATGAANSGTMYNRIIIDRTVTDTQTLTIEQDISIT
jgi:hypothetical protein